MFIKIFGKSSLPQCLRLCHQAEEAVSQGRGRDALSMAFLDLDERAGQRQARLHHVHEPGPALVATSEAGEELVRCEEEASARAFLDGLMANR